MSSIAPSLLPTKRTSAEMHTKMVRFCAEPTPMVTVAADEEMLAAARELITDEANEVVKSWKRLTPEAFLTWVHPMITWQPPLNGSISTSRALLVQCILAPRLAVYKANRATSSQFRSNAVPDAVSMSVQFYQSFHAAQAHILSYATHAIIVRLNMSHLMADSPDDIWFILTSVALPILLRYAMCVNATHSVSKHVHALSIVCYDAATTLRARGPGPWLTTKVGTAAHKLLAVSLDTIIKARTLGLIETFDTEDESAVWRTACAPHAKPLFRAVPLPKPASDETDELHSDDDTSAFEDWVQSS